MNPIKNVLFVFFIILITVTLIGTSHAVYVDMPDYTILSVTPDRYTQVEGGIIVFTTVVKNVGDGATLRSSSLIWEVCTKFCAKEENWSIKETDIISGLKVGQEEIETYSHEMTYGPTNLRVKCDYVDGNNFGVIIEKNEDENYSEDDDNNILRPPLTITTEHPDLAIATYDENATHPMIWWSPKYPIEGQEVTFYAGISNMGKGGTIEELEVEFFVYPDQDPYNPVSLGSEKYKGGIPLGPMPQNYTFCYISSKSTWPAVPGSHIIEAYVNSNEKIDEGTNKKENKSQVDIIDFVQKSDLTISNVWWVPEMPKDGEEVTFYASVQNIGLGGSILEFNVDFTLKESVSGVYLNEIDLGSATIKDHILPAQKKPIHADGSGAFENVSYLSETDWKVISGSVSIERHCAETDSMCSRLLEESSNLNYVHLSGANAIIRSTSSFPISEEDKTLVFRAIASGSGKRWVSLCNPGTDCTGSNQLLTQEIATSKDNWQAYIMDVSPLVGSQVTCEIRTGTSTNSILKVDDIRMTPDYSINNQQPVMVSIPFSDTWEAFPFSDKITYTPGHFKITAKLSENNTLQESDPNNQELTVNLHDDPLSPWMAPADYDFVSIHVSPPSQFIGKNFLYEVAIKNYGGPTLIESNLNWYLSEKEGQYGKSLETDKIPGLLTDEKIVHSFELPAVSGNINVYAFLNDDFVLKEKNIWSQDDLRYNRAFDIRYVNDVDLSVKKVWWRVENPLDGQDPSKPLEGQDVRFYARIDNVGHGGAITDFDVQFIVDEDEYESIDLKTTTVKDDILFGKLGWNSQTGFTNADFEGNCQGSDDKLCGWTIENGSVSAESYCGIDDTQCICSRSNDSELGVTDCNPNNVKGNLHYARLYGGGTKFRSSSFYVNGDIIEFKAQVTGSGTKKLRLCEDNSSNCLEQTYTDKSFWNAYVLDVSSFIGKKVYMELSIEGSGNIEFWVDDFRMDISNDSSVYVTTVESKNTWTASTGLHRISVIADVKNVLSEPDDYDPNIGSKDSNNIISKYPIDKIFKTDYEIIQPPFIPILQYQIQGRDISVTAKVTNNGSGTSLETDLYWYTCLDTNNPSCADIDNWESTWGSPATKETVPALANGQSFTSTYTYTAEYGKTFIIAKVNPEQNVSEDYLNNNIVYYGFNDEFTKVYKPRLNVQSIWWIPQKPKDGEEVTFYAAIENMWSFYTGGTLEDFEVNFILQDQTNPNQTEDLGTTKVKDDILLADRRIIEEFKNSVFATTVTSETNKLAPWQRITGAFSIEDRCYQQGTTCEETITNRYFTRLYGANTLLRSNDFVLENDLIVFTGYTNGTGTKTIRIRQMEYSIPQPKTDPILYENQYTEKQTWRANLIKMPSGHTNEKVYIEALTQGAANAEFFIDDFRMSQPSTDDVFVSIVASNKVWTAQPGSFDISVAVSVEGAGGSGLKKELVGDDPNDNTLIKKADYIVIGPTFNLQKQIQGKDIQATAIIKNVGDTTLVESEIQWEVGGKTAKEKLAGLAANEMYTSTYTFTPEYGPNEVKITADATNTINEADENNTIIDNQSIIIDKPELEIGSIWWSPETLKDGEEVTFFARIDNIGKGGSSDDIEVRFLVSQGEAGKQVEISKEKVTADIPFALGTAAFANADFSGEDNSLCSGLPTCNSPDKLKNWDIYGVVFDESRCTIDDTACVENDKMISLIDTPNLYQCGFESYARLYGGDTKLTSQVPLKKMSVKYILFKAYASGSGDKKVQLLDSSGTPVIELPITEKSWAAKIIDVAPYNLDFIGQDYYFRAVTEGSSNAELLLDDIRLVSTTEDTCRVMVAKVQASKTWIAQPKLSDSANDYYVHVEITNTNVTKSLVIDPVIKSDYQIKTITHTPKEQIKGKNVSFVALLENTGADTLVESELSWFTCYAYCDDDTNWKKIWKEVQTETISPLASGAQYTSTFVLTSEFNKNYVRVFCDSGDVIVEPDENVSLFNYNNIKDDYIDIQQPDLRVSSIGHYPKEPVDGQEVIFYAQIENIFDGGTNDEIETTFLVTDANGVETSIDAEKSSNEVMFARRQWIYFDNTDPAIGSNAGFELGSMRSWKSQGSVFLEKEALTKEYYKIIKESNARNDQYFVKISGDGSKLLSSPFTINAQSIIFKGQTSGAGTKQVSVRKCSSTECTPFASDTILMSQEFTESSPWRSFVLDVSQFHNQHVYLEIKTSGAANSEFWVDDFRMKTGTDYTYVTTVQSKNAWIAFPGLHKLRATVDSSQSIPENDESNNYLEAEFMLNNAVDYSITSLTYTPKEQIQGKEIIFTALIENVSLNSTLIESELEWFVCQGDKIHCDHNKKWSSQSKEKISGLASGSVYESTFNMEVTYDDKEPKNDDNYVLQVKVVCDTGNVLAEDNGPGAENNNSAEQHIVVYFPDLAVGDIWWIPENPVDGEPVTFYARIDNYGAGGSIQDFEVNFTVDYKNTSQKTDLGESKIATEIPFGKRQIIDSFESGLTPWTRISGNVYWEYQCLETDIQCPGNSANNRYHDLRYASVYGSNSILQSGHFNRIGNSLLFKGMTDGSGTKKLVVYDGFNKKRIERTYADKAPWHAYVVDIQKDDLGKEIPFNTDLYLQIQTSGSDNATFMVDDFRIGGDPTEFSVVGYVESNNTWTATPDFLNQGVHTITAIIDEKGDVKEAPYMENTLTKDLKTVARSNYTVTSMEYSPRKQIQGRNIELTAIIENSNATTLRDSEVQWFTCQDSKLTCQKGSENEAYWKSQQIDKIEGGIAEGQKYSVVYNMTVPAYEGTDNSNGYTVYVKVKADSKSNIQEKDDAEENEFVQAIPIDHPDLIVKDVWWIPENPIDGQEVTFYAQIFNQGSGGTLQDYEVSFVIDKDDKNNIEDLGTAKMQDDILLGNRLPLVSYAASIGLTKTIGDFENNIVLSKSDDTWPVTDWTRYSGEVYIANHFDETALPQSERITVYNKKYLHVSGSGSLVKSPPFQLMDDELMFRAQTNGSGNKTLRIRPLNPDPVNGIIDPLIERNYNDKSPWRAYLIDIEKWRKVIAFMEIETSNGTILIDDFRMNKTSNAKGIINVGTAANSKAWLARHGAELTVFVDGNDDIFESDANNNSSKNARSSGMRWTGRRYPWDRELKLNEYNNLFKTTILLAKHMDGLGDIDGNGESDLTDLIIAAQIVANFNHSFNGNILIDKIDVDNDNQIGLAEIVYLMIHIAENQNSRE